MKMVPIFQRPMAASLCLLLFSCGVSRSSALHPASVQELSRLVLVIKEKPDGQAIHSWEPLNGFDLSKYPYRASNGTEESPIVRVGWTRSCEDEFDDCVERCVKSLRGRTWSHANRGSKAGICRDRCRPAYNDCCRLRDQAEALKFPDIDQAVAWLTQHHEELVVGTMVAIAGVAFVVVAVGSGGAALILVPAVLLVSSDVPSAPHLAIVQP